MKTSGTSLIPAAMPTPMPCHQRRSGWHRSHMTSAISSSSTWPRYMTCSTGAIQNSTAVASSVPPSLVSLSRYPSAPSVTQIVTGSAARLARLQRPMTRCHGSGASTANSRATKGGYVN
jgi:hypothetical protein